MIKSTDYIPDDARKEAEQSALAELLGIFSKEMAQKVMLKLESGYSGWDNPTVEATMRQKLEKNLQENDMVDVAVLAMMLWNLKQDNNAGSPN